MGNDGRRSYRPSDEKRGTRKWEEKKNSSGERKEWGDKKKRTDRFKSKDVRQIGAKDSSKKDNRITSDDKKTFGLNERKNAGHKPSTVKHTDDSRRSFERKTTGNSFNDREKKSFEKKTYGTRLADNKEKRTREADQKTPYSSNSKRRAYNDGNKKDQRTARSTSIAGAAAAKFETEERKKRYPAGQYCPYERWCGGCRYLDMTYDEQLALKEQQVRDLMERFCKVYPITGMEDPFHYRNKVTSTFAWTKNGPISGIYEEGTHNVINVDFCLIEDELADQIVGTIRRLLSSFKITIYNEDSEYGLLRHVMIRKGRISGEVMVVLVCSSPVFPSKNNFVRALREAYPEITTVVLNVNDRHTSMVLGERNIVLYGPGYIEDTLCGLKYRISPQSFYQINSLQTEKLYGKAVEVAELHGTENVIDAYCGIGTIGMTAASRAGEVLGVELNAEAVRDARQNAKANGVKNIRFISGDAGKYMTELAAKGEKANLVFMDPPRSGSSEEFLHALTVMQPPKIVYVSCNPETLARDVAWLTKHGYSAKGCWPFDCFCWTEHVETVVLMSRAQK